MIRWIALALIGAGLIVGCGGDASSESDDPASGAETVAVTGPSSTPTPTLTAEPTTMLATEGAPESSSSPATNGTPDMENFVGILPTYSPQQIADAVPEAPPPAPLDRIDIPADYDAAKALIDRLPEQIDDLESAPIGFEPEYAYGVSYLPEGAESPSETPIGIHAWVLPVVEPSIRDWSVDDRVANDIIGKGLGKHLESAEPYEGGHDGDLYWLKTGTDGGRLTFGRADSQVMFDISASSDKLLRLALDAFAVAASGESSFDPDDFIGGMPTYAPELIAEVVPEAPAPAPLDMADVPDEYDTARALIDRLPDAIGGLVQTPVVPPPGQGYYGKIYLPEGADPPTHPPISIVAANLPETDPSMRHWTADDKVANDLLDARGAFEGGIGTVPPEGGHDGDLYWIKVERDGIRMTWGRADSPVVFQVVAPSAESLQLALDAFAQAAMGGSS